MDFLFLFLFYVMLVLVAGVLIYLGLRTQYLNGLMGRGAQVFSRLVPGCLQSAVLRSLHYLFHTRNRSFLILHLLLQGTVYTEYSWEVLGYCLELGFSLYYLLLPYLLLSINLVFFTLTCVSNPGVCDCCVHRFDHHCIWVNNCIGAWNIRHFLVYLCTLTASAMALAVVSTVFLGHLVVAADLYSGTYIDARGRVQVIDFIFLAQHLFLSFPRIVFMLGFVLVLSFLLGGYLCFMLYLAATNQTTNEWYKSHRTRCQHHPNMCQLPPTKPQGSQNFYSRGLWSNLSEIFLSAPVFLGRKKK
ncbi:palmitoyltransferase ZDHHC4 isoform X2 [Sorex araneus]|uniref:palmitoyltransferase ZDHHC4 isoform X2 n=1 Tax=Sorex araneus TaxID=42254 RepID=UPI0024338E5E|nr:palmitoyltransferase ZDHHC4 isoform X2 [Sorex araneus]